MRWAPWISLRICWPNLSNKLMKSKSTSLTKSNRYWLKTSNSSRTLGRSSLGQVRECSINNKRCKHAVALCLRWQAWNISQTFFSRESRSLQVNLSKLIKGVKLVLLSVRLQLWSTPRNRQLIICKPWPAILCQIYRGLAAISVLCKSMISRC